MFKAFVARWGRWYGGYVSPPQPGDAVTLHVAVMGVADSYECLRRALIDHGITRLVELREDGQGCEMDTAAATFEYNGDEGFWTSGDMEWMVYASHESSITFGGGWLIQAMRKCLPEFDRYLYRGWDLSAYDVEKT